MTIKKSFLSFSILIISTYLMAQNDSVKSGVYSWKSVKSEKVDGRDRKQVLDGNTFDLAELEIHSSTLEAWQSPHPPHVHEDFEELIIVKEGKLKVIIKDSTKILGPGGLALAVAGDKHGFQNASDKPVIYYILKFKPKGSEKNKQGTEAGSFMKDWTELVTEKTDKGERRSIFDRPTPLFGKLEVHSTSLNAGFASHDPHTHRAEEIILMIKGNVQMQIGRDFYKAEAGDLIFLGSNILHALKNTGPQQCSYFAIQWLK
jgi:(S)-ureidoglycine aminohydrolase